MQWTLYSGFIYEFTTTWAASIVLKDGFERDSRPKQHCNLTLVVLPNVGTSESHCCRPSYSSNSVSLISDSLFFRSDLFEVGDVIVSVDGVSTIGLTSDHVTSMLRRQQPSSAFDHRRSPSPTMSRDVEIVIEYQLPEPGHR